MDPLIENRKSKTENPQTFTPGPLKKLFADGHDVRFWQTEGLQHSYLSWVRAMLTEEVESPPFHPHPWPLPRHTGEGFARARRVAYGFLADAWIYPTAEMLAHFTDSQFAASLVEAWTCLTGNALAAKELSDLNLNELREQDPVGGQRSAIGGRHSLDRLRAEFTRLFYDTYLPFIPPYESVYCNERQVMGQRAAAVIEFYRRAGLAAEGEMPDHIAHECEFVAHLAGEETAARETGDSARAAALREMQAEFMREHLLPWGVKFCADLACLARGDFYIVTARLGSALFNAEWARISQRVG